MKARGGQLALGVLAAFIFMHAGLTTLSSPSEELSFPTHFILAVLPVIPLYSYKLQWVCKCRLTGPTALSPGAAGPGWPAVLSPSWPWDGGDTWWMRVDDHADLDAVWLCYRSDTARGGSEPRGHCA